MARGKKTGGRTFKKGNRGRPKGAKDKVPRNFKGSIALLYQQLARDQPALFADALVKGLKGKAAFAFFQLGAHYIDGKPTETVKLIDERKLSDETIQRVLADLDNKKGNDES